MSNNNLDEELVDFDFDELDSSPTNESNLNESNPFDVDDSDNAFSDAPADNPFGENDAAPFGDESLNSQSPETESSDEIGVIGEIDQDNPLGGFDGADTVQLAELPEELTAPPKKKGWFSKKEKAAPKEKAPKAKVEKSTVEKTKKEKAEKKPKVKKEKDTNTAPKDWNGILCLVFAGFLLFAMLAVNVCSILGRGENLMQTLCFIGAFDCIGLCAAAVPIAFYRHREELNVLKVMLGVASVALFIGVLILLTEFYHYNFIIKP